MRIEEVIKLIDAGYSKADIEMMTADGEVIGTIASAEPVTEAQEPEKAPEPAAVSPEFGNDFIKQMQQTLDGFITKLQAANVQAARLPDQQVTKPEDLLAKIINPPGMKGEK